MRAFTVWQYAGRYGTTFARCNGAIGSDKVDTTQIADDAVEAAQLATGSVGSDALAATAVQSTVATCICSYMYI